MGEVAEPAGGSAKVLQSPVDGLCGAVASARCGSKNAGTSQARKDNQTSLHGDGGTGSPPRPMQSRTRRRGLGSIGDLWRAPQLRACASPQVCWRVALQL